MTTQHVERGVGISWRRGCEEFSDSLSKGSAGLMPLPFWAIGRFYPLQQATVLAH